MAARRGFAALSPERRREIASQGGKAAQATGKGHRWSPEETVAMGQRGGLKRFRNWQKRRLDELTPTRGEEVAEDVSVPGEVSAVDAT